MGWMTKDENLVPLMTDLPPAPDELLRVIRCNCTMIAAQPDAVVASTVWTVPLHAVSAEVSDVPTAPRLI